MKPPGKVTRVVLLSCLVVMLVSCGGWILQNRTGIAAKGKDAPVAGLPDDATDVRWLLPGAFGPNMFYDFSTTEQGYRQWVADGGPSALTGPVYGPYTIYVYDHDENAFAEREFKDAIAYSWHEEDRGVYMVYDREHGRAYFHAHSR